MEETFRCGVIRETPSHQGDSLQLRFGCISILALFYALVVRGEIGISSFRTTRSSYPQDGSACR
jgi:hypothetical protein